MKLEAALKKIRNSAKKVDRKVDITQNDYHINGQVKVYVSFEYSNQIAEGAAMMTDTKLISTRILGSAWPRHFNEPIAKAMYDNA